MLDSSLARIGKIIYFHVQFYKSLSLLQPTLSKQETNNVTKQDQKMIILVDFNGSFDEYRISLSSSWSKELNVRSVFQAGFWYLVWRVWLSNANSYYFFWSGKWPVLKKMFSFILCCHRFWINYFSHCFVFCFYICLIWSICQSVVTFEGV